jgi:hypothetical protein
VTVLFFKKEYEFLRGQGVPPFAAPEGGLILRKQSRFFIDEIGNNLQSPEAFLRKK